MADYNAILRRTLEGLGATTPELREKLFSRARTTISRQLESTTPPMSKKAIAEQTALLEAAIAAIENEYRATETPVEPLPAEVPVDLPAAEAQIASPPPDDIAADDFPTISDEPVQIPAADDDQPIPAGNLELPQPSSGRSTLIVMLIALLVIGGGAAALWLNRATLLEAYNQFMNSDRPAITDNSGQSDSNVDGKSVESQPAVSTVKDDEKLPESTIAETAVTEKFDQRLNSDGEETAPEPIRENNDSLPAGVAPSPVTTTRIVVPDTGSDAPEALASPPVETVAEAGKIPVVEGNPVIFAQKGLLYEEGAAQNQNSVDVGTVVWSIVQEAPAEGLPLEPAIRAKVEIASRNLILLMTIKRNADKALPASHIIELVFSVPDDFSGGGIDKIQRFVFKQSEQARGEALVGVPATIADGIFLIALNNLSEAVTRNTALMKEQEWIDIPLGYRTGRRALITIEKGVPGSRVFKEAFDAWEKAG